MKKVNQKGVTLLALIITIVILLILASIATYSGIDIIRSSKLTTFTAEMKIMQTQVNKLYDQWKSGEINIDESNGNITKQENGQTVNIGKDLTYDSTVEDQSTYVLIDELGLGNSLNDLKRYKYFDQETIKILQIEGVDGEFFIDITDRKVVSYEGLKYDGDMYYTLEQLPRSLYNVDYEPGQYESPTFELEYEKIGEEKWRITVSNIQYDGYINKWTVKYQEDGKEDWNISEDLSFVVDKEWIYNITIENGEVKSGTEKIIINEPNSPKLGEGMIPIKWENNNWVICSKNDPEWYDYINQEEGEDGTSKWANIMLSDGKYYATNSSNVDKTGKEEAKEGTVVEKDDLGSMFVWIPRYAYEIESGYHSNTDEKIKISFLKGTEKYNIGDEICYASQEEIGREKIKNESGEGNWNEHPAFTYGEDIVEGIWVAKFEASSSSPSNSYGGGNVTNLKVKSLPGITSWRYISIGNSYTNCANMNNTSNASFYGISDDDNEIDPHLLKNSEWGAIAYLTQSSYGRNQNEITINNDSEYITGSAGSSTNASSNVGTTNDYTDSKGVLASTTGNQTGIYDMSGGTWEFIAGYINNGNSRLTTNGQALLDAPEEHKNVYDAYDSNGELITSGTDNRANNYDKGMKYIFGDAIYETSSTYSGYKSWHGDYSYCPYSATPFFRKRRLL